jgi:hypothetical protein
MFLVELMIYVVPDLISSSSSVSNLFVLLFGLLVFYLRLYNSLFWETRERFFAQTKCRYCPVRIIFNLSPLEEMLPNSLIIRG